MNRVGIIFFLFLQVTILIVPSCDGETVCEQTSPMILMHSLEKSIETGDKERFVGLLHGSTGRTRMMTKWFETIQVFYEFQAKIIMAYGKDAWIKYQSIQLSQDIEFATLKRGSNWSEQVNFVCIDTNTISCQHEDFSFPIVIGKSLDCWYIDLNRTLGEGLSESEIAIEYNIKLAEHVQAAFSHGIQLMEKDPKITT